MWGTKGQPSLSQEETHSGVPFILFELPGWSWSLPEMTSLLSFISPHPHLVLLPSGPFSWGSPSISHLHKNPHFKGKVDSQETKTDTLAVNWYLLSGFIRFGLVVFSIVGFCIIYFLKIITPLWLSWYEVSSCILQVNKSKVCRVPTSILTWVT